MSEQSHLDEMRSAIRGDFARLAERRGDQELMRVSAEPNDDAELPANSLELDHEPPVRRSWLARLVSL